MEIVHFLLKHFDRSQNTDFWPSLRNPEIGNTPGMLNAGCRGTDVEVFDVNEHLTFWAGIYFTARG